jgi:hypothetical protein
VFDPMAPLEQTVWGQLWATAKIVLGARLGSREQ